jgi:hypothetical protein
MDKSCGAVYAMVSLLDRCVFAFGAGTQDCGESADQNSANMAAEAEFVNGKNGG